MSRGGAGRGQGRRPNVTSPELEFLIREDFARLSWRKRLEQANKVASRAAGVVWGEDGAPNPVEQVPQKYRYLVSKYGSLEPEAKIPNKLDIQDPSDEETVRWVIGVMRDNKKRMQGKRLHYEIPLPALYRGRQKIIKDIARSRGVPERTVRSIIERK